MLAGLAVLLVVALGAGVLAVLQPWSDEPAVDPPVVPQDVPGPVLLVPGYGGSTASLQPLAERVRAAGRDATVVDLPGDGRGDLREAAASLDTSVTAALSSGAHSVDLVGYSAGGVTIRLWVREHAGETKARRIVTLGSPHHGAQVAALGVLLGDDEVCPLGCQQLAPNSEVLTELNAGDEAPEGPRWVSVWSRYDDVVTPVDSASLLGAVDVPLQDVCADSRADHGALPRDPLATGLVLAAIGPGLDSVPGPGECAELRAAGRG
ncbi:lipase [Motilibacter sp. E257]|uniref:Lipase n=1 Tax=Motilibacter deserti TaxID=2714956 RepID=A0ABX0GYE7_9ACTN|nr:lipase [Motilibacter deserti]